MDPNSENDPARLARHRLSQFCGSRDRAVRRCWLLAICEAILLVTLALALLDYWWMLPPVARTTGALALAALAMLGVARLIGFYRRPTGLKKGALEVESQRPDLGCEISTAAEYLSGERQVVHEYEPELAAALEARAAQHLGTAPINYGSKLRLYGAILGVSLLGLLCLVIAVPAMLTALQRTTIPFSKAHYTKVEVRPGNIEIPVGQDLDVTNVFTGRLPKNPRLHWQEAGAARWQEVALTNSLAGIYRLTLTNIRCDTSYRATGGDGASEIYRITTYVPPAVRDLTVMIRFPDYTGLNPAIQKSPDIAVVRASTAEMHLEPSVELASAKLRFSALPELTLTPEPNGFWGGSFQVTKDTDYWIELEDKKGHHGVNEKPYHIRAIPDNPPKIEISEPAKDIRASNTNKVLVRMSVTDDFGINEIKLVVNKLGDAQRVIPATRESMRDGEITATAELDLSALELKEYELVAYHAEATDNNTLDGPGVGKSPVYFVEITNEEGKPCLSQGQGQKVNLLVIQKQIIADSTALAPKAKAEEFDNMSTRQKDAAEFGQMYLDALEGGGAPATAVNEMQAALHDMTNAATRLQEKNRAEALPAEEGALAHMYQVLRLLPELENFPTAPSTANQQSPASPKLKVVLEAIKQRKKEDVTNQEIHEALDQAKDLARAQSALNSVLRHPESGSSKASGSESRSPSARQPETGGAEGQSDSQSPAASQEASSPSAKEMAENQNRLSEEARRLAEKLQRMAGRNSRLGHNAGNDASQAASKMAAAGQAMGQGNLGLAGQQGVESEVALHGVIARLERLLKNQPEPSDIANEDFPKAYEALISEYLKKLSHAE
jgi:hypothetical protein